MICFHKKVQGLYEEQKSTVLFLVVISSWIEESYYLRVFQ